MPAYDEGYTTTMKSMPAGYANRMVCRNEEYSRQENPESINNKITSYKRHNKKCSQDAGEPEHMLKSRGTSVYTVGLPYVNNIVCK